MGKPYPVELRQRVVDHVAEAQRRAHGHRGGGVPFGRVSGSRSRHSIAWSDAQISRVSDAIAEFGFLSLANPGKPS